MLFSIVTPAASHVLRDLIGHSNKEGRSYFFHRATDQNVSAVLINLLHIDYNNTNHELLSSSPVLWKKPESWIDNKL